MGGWTIEYKEELVMEMAEKMAEKAASLPPSWLLRSPSPWRWIHGGGRQTPPKLGLTMTAATELFMDFYSDPLYF